MTLLDYAAAMPDDLSKYSGKSYKSQLLGRAGDGWANCFVGEYGTVRTIRDQQFKLVLRFSEGENLLIDLVDDPRETVNLYDDANFGAVVDSMRTQLEQFFARYEVAEHSGLLGKRLPIHNKREAWRTKEQWSSSQI